MASVSTGRCGNVFADVPTGDATKKCLRTLKVIPIHCFDINPNTGNPYCFCVVCKPKSRAREKAWLKTASGKASRKRTNASDTAQSAKALYRNSAIGKAKAEARAQTEEFLQSCRNYAKSAKGKESRKRSYKKNTLSQQLLNGVARILRGGNSPKTLKHIAFSSSSDVRSHFRPLVEVMGCTMADYGKKWCVDHRIPRSKYDHKMPTEVLKCWSKQNMHPIPPKTNKKKFVAVTNIELDAVPAELWPCGFKA